MAASISLSNADSSAARRSSGSRAMASKPPWRRGQREVARDGSARWLVAARRRTWIVLQLGLEGARRLMREPVLAPRPEEGAELRRRERSADGVDAERLPRHELRGVPSRCDSDPSPLVDRGFGHHHFHAGLVSTRRISRASARLLVTGGRFGVAGDE